MSDWSYEGKASCSVHISTPYIAVNSVFGGVTNIKIKIYRETVFTVMSSRSQLSRNVAVIGSLVAEGKAITRWLFVRPNTERLG